MKKIFYFLVFIVVILVAAVLYVRVFVEDENIYAGAPANAKFLDIGNGEEIAYQEINNNAQTTVIFVGGLSGWSETWTRTINELNTQSKEYNYIAIDLPPFGYSTADLKKGFFRDIQAQRINDFRKNKNLDQVMFVAHSYGAGPTTEAVMTNPNGVMRLIVIDGVLNIDEQKVVKKRALLDSPFISYGINLVSHSDAFAKNRVRSFAFKKEGIDDVITERYTRPFTVKGNADRLAVWLRDYIEDPLVYKSTDSAEYRKLSMPVRIIWGDRDTLTPISLGKNLLQNINDGTLYSLTDVGHMPMIEDYDQFDKSLLNAIFY